MLLKKFSVKNYKNFKEIFTLDFSNIKPYKFNEICLRNNLLKNIIIYGKNSVGKTNFGLAIFDITYHLVDKNKTDKVNQNYLNADSEQKEAEFWYEFQFGDKIIKYYYRKKDVFHLTYEQLFIDGKKVFSYDYSNGEGDLSQLKNFGLGTLNWRLRENNISLVRYMANNLPLAEDHPIMQLMHFVSGMLWFCSRDFNNDYLGYTTGREYMDDFIIRNGYTDEFEKFLHEYGVDENIVGIENPNASESLYFKHKQLVPFSLASSGTNALLTFFYWYKQLKNVTFLLIDEFDAFYHFELAEKIVKLLEKQVNIQVILTSHNTSLMTNRIMRPDCYFILTKEKLTSLADATTRELRQGHNLEKLYMSGEFDE